MMKEITVVEIIERIQEEKGWTDATLLMVLKEMLEDLDELFSTVAMTVTTLETFVEENLENR